MRISHSYAELNGIWNLLDSDGNGIVSLAEVQKLVITKYPLLNHQQALLRAYMYTTLRDGGDGDAFIERHEFIALLRNILYFNKVLSLFDQLDGHHEHKISRAEFKLGCERLGMAVTDSEVREAFSDPAIGEKMLFNQFCAWIAKAHCPIDEDVHNSFVTSEDAVKLMKKISHTETHHKSGQLHHPQSGSIATGFHTKRFDVVESDIKDLATNIKRVQGKIQHFQ